MIKIIPELCTQCQLCVKICPSRIFLMKNDNIGTAYEEYCILCGHCLSVCPEEAIRHEKLDYKAFQEISKRTHDPQFIFDLFQERRSIRNFKDKAIPESLIEELLEKSCYAPTASNTQNVKFLVLQNEAIPLFVTNVREFYIQLLELLQDSSVEDKTMLRRMRKWKYWQEEAELGKDAIFFDPPVIVIVYAAKEDSLSVLNAGFTTSYFMLAAHSHGLGTCNIGYALEAIKRRPEIAEELGISEEEQIFAILSLGYPSIKFQRIPVRNSPTINWRT